MGSLRVCLIPGFSGFTMGLSDSGFSGFTMGLSDSGFSRFTMGLDSVGSLWVWIQ